MPANKDYFELVYESHHEIKECIRLSASEFQLLRDLIREIRKVPKIPIEESK